MTDNTRNLFSASVANNPGVTQAPGLHGIVDSPAPAITGNPGGENEVSQVSHDWQKRYGDLQRHLATKETEIAQLKAKSNTFTAPKTPEELQAFRVEQPEVYAVIQTIAHEMAEQSNSVIAGELSTVKDTLNKTTVEAGMERLHLRHPDMEAIHNSPDFMPWLSTKSTEVQSWILNNPDKPNLVSDVIDMFKAETPWGVVNEQASQGNQNQNQFNQVNQEALEASRSVANRGPQETLTGDPRSNPQYVWGEREVQKLSDSDYAAHEGAIDLAHSEGRIDPSR